MPGTASARSTAGRPDSPTDLPAPTWRATLRRAIGQVKHDQLTDRAAALTYYGVLALFPGLLVLLSILGLLGESTTQNLLDNVGRIAPGGVRSFLEQVVSQAQGRRGVAGLAAVLGLVAALWSASGYIAAFMRAANSIYGVGEGRPIWKTLPVRIGTTLAIVVLLVISAAIVVFTGRIADQVGQAIGLGSVAVTAWEIAKWPALVVLVSLMFTLLYWACPNVKQPGFRWVSPGGALAVLIWMVASGAFAVYLGTFAPYNRTYGSLAGVIIFLVWLWITNLAVLLGAEFNAEIEHARAIRAGLPADVEPFVELRDTRKLDPAQQADVDRAEQRARSRHPQQTPATDPRR